MKFENCRLCPRQCGADRKKQQGFCGGTDKIKAARAALHFWEEPCISGTNGSGTIFFSGCCLRCCFCQNYKISAENFGKEISVERLSRIFLELQQQGAHNINLVNPTHYVPWIIQALQKVKKQLTIPIVYNSGGYESVETLKMLEGYVDIYLPDLKYFSSELSYRYSKASDYFQVAATAIKEMVRQTGNPLFNADGLLQKGTILRHMVLPMGYKDSIKIIEWVASHFLPNQILISLMSQYTPCYQTEKYSEINRRIFSYEYHKVLDCVQDYGFDGFMQEKSAAKVEYTPSFNLEGI